MNLREILRSKGTRVHTIAPTAMVSDAVQFMVQNRCGSLVVAESNKMVGIITERDILRCVADETQVLETTPVSSRMTSDVVTGHPDDDLGKVMGVMTAHHIRHLPVLDNGELLGLVSIGDVVKAQYNQLSRENHFLMSYIQS